MADFMNVLAASQKQTVGGKQSNPLASLLPDGLFGSVLSAQLEPPLGEGVTLALPAALVDGLAIQVKPGDKKVALAAETDATAEAQVALLPVIVDKNVGQRAQLTAASPAGSGVSRGQELPLADRAQPLANPAMVAAQAATVSATPAAPLLTVATDASPAADMTSVNAARQLGQFEQIVRTPESRVQVALEAPVRSQAFPAEFSEKIVWLAGRQSQWANMSLNPPQLGAIEVRLSLSGGEAGAQFFSPHPAVREVIEAALPRLRELMAQAGIALGDAQVRDEAFARQESGGSNQARGSASPGEILFPTTSLAMNTRAGVGLVDLYV